MHVPFPAVAGLSPLFNCLHCNASFAPDRRNLGRQRFCAQPECRAFSKRSSQRAWLTQKANADCLKGSDHVQRVREWRARSPGYWKRSRRPNDRVILGSQPSESTQPVDPQLTPVQASPLALQDSWRGAVQASFIPHHPLFVGFIAFQMGCALQDDILRHCDAMAAKGLEILRHGAAGPLFSA